MCSVFTYWWCLFEFDATRVWYNYYSFIDDSNSRHLKYQNDTVAERLRRPTRNRLGLSRVGSSPAGVDVFVCGVLLTRTADSKWRWWYADYFQVVVHQKQWRVFAFESYKYCCTVCTAWLYIVSSTVCDLKKSGGPLSPNFLVGIYSFIVL